MPGNGHTITRVALVLAAVLGAIAPDRAVAQVAGDDSWQFSSPSKIEFFRQSPTGHLLVATEDSLVALDAVTGAIAWSQPELRLSSSLMLVTDAAHSLGVADTRRRLWVFDLRTGEILWTEARLPPFRELRGYRWVGAAQQDVMLLFAKTENSDRTLFVLDPVTGELLWQTDSLLAESPKFEREGDAPYITETQAFLMDGDGRLTFWMSKDGPLQLNWRTGQVLWRADSLQGKSVAGLSEGYAPMVPHDTLLIVPYDRTLIALDMRDGHVLWHRDRNFPAAVTQMELTPHGMLVRGADRFMDLLDPVSGASRWETQIRDLEGGTAFHVSAGSAWLAAGDRLIAIDLETGTTREIARIEFQGGEQPVRVDRVDGALLLTSRQNVMRCALDGTVLYHEFYKAPGTSFLQKVAGVMTGDWSPMSARYGRSEGGVRYLYFFTERPSASGREGFSLARVQVADGREAGRVWFENKTPTYLIDWEHGGERIFFQSDDRVIVALPFR